MVRQTGTGLHKRILAFGATGGVGFAVDAGILQGLFVFGLSPLLARCVSFPVAVTATWLLNKHFTFRDRPDSGARSRYLLYVGGQVAGGLINFCAFVLTMRQWPALATRPIIPLMVGSALALLFNFTWDNALVFKARPLPPPAVARQKRPAR